MFGRHEQGSGPPKPTVSWALFSLQGRISRATYLLGIAFMLSLLAVVVAFITNTPQESALFPTWGLVFILLGMVSCYSLFALALKRLQDMGWPRPMIALVLFPPTTFVFLLILAAVPGSPHANDHGNPPFG